jgi:cation diffusion facilitator family transporter
MKGASTIQHTDPKGVEPHIRRIYTQASVVGLVGNIVLVGAKGVVARISGSSAIYADAANSASDVAYSVLMLVGLWLSLRPADTSHPHGHRRIEPLVSIIIGLMMTLAAFEAGRNSIATWREGPQAIVSIWALVVPGVTAVIKGGMYLTVKRFAVRASSPALGAAARDNLVDVLTSVLAFVGVVGSRVIAPLADPVAGLLVVPWILHNAWEVFSESIHQLIGGHASPELVETIIERAGAVSGVLDVHQVIVEYVGPQVRVDIHINMEADQPLTVVHDVSDTVRERIEELEEVDHAFVHAEPPWVTSATHRAEESQAAKEPSDGSS